MRVYFFSIFTSFLLCTACWQCKTSSKNGTIDLGKNAQIVLVDSTKAANLITNDETDRIFSQITETDMCIQMKKNYPSETFRSQILNDYIDYLEKDVANFSPDEATLMTAVMEDVYELCNKVSSTVFPKKINIIKTKGRHYGDGVYYTRENCIIVPANVINKNTKEELFSTMIHEIFHVYSRANPEKRKLLYELIGFKAANEDFVIDEPLKSRILLNPDGVNFRYIIHLQISPDKEIQAVPIIYSTEPIFKKNKPSFFNYLRFELFEVKKVNEKMVIVAKKDGSSTLNIKDLPDFWQQIRDNTQYIIHPDEVLADNFMFLVKSQKDEKVSEKFSADGKKLLEEIKNIIK